MFDIKIDGMKMLHFFFRSRSFCCGLAGVLLQIFAFTPTKTYYDLENLMSIPGVICFYGVIAVVGLVACYDIHFLVFINTFNSQLFIFRFILTWLLLPETENRTLEEIELHFSDNNRSIFDIQIKKK